MKLIIVIIVLVAIAALSWLWLGVLRNQLSALSMVDSPNERSLHQGQVPRGGGVVFVFFLVASLLLMMVWSDRHQTFAALAILTTSWAALGWFDDRRDLSPSLRLAWQLLLAIVTLALFGFVTELKLSNELVLVLGWGGALLSLVGLLWFVNLYNFMDGMDGLAASQTIIACLTLAWWLLILGDWWLALCCLTLAAATYGFLLRNWNPASIFMGDVGSIALGAFFGTLMIYLNTFHNIPILCLILIFAVFVADTSITVLKRMLRAERIWLPHRSHYYQRFAALGVNHGHIVLGCIILMIVCSIAASLAMADHARIPQVCVFVVGLLLSCIVVIRRMETKRT